MVDQIDSAGALDQISTVPDDRSTATKRASKSGKNAEGSQTGSTDSEHKASKKPKNTALKQQRLPAWQPILTAKTVFPLFFGIGIIFVALGGVLLHYSNIVNEYVIDYTDKCVAINGEGKCSELSNLSVSCECVIDFNLDVKYEKPVYLYYGLKNFYQNHRRYVKSRDDTQLLGNKVDSLNSECSPYDYYSDANSTYSNRSQYAPCGAIANSLFSDKFKLEKNGIEISVIKTGIAWETDKTVKFRNPKGDNPWAGTIKPKNWRVPVQDLDTEDKDNTGYINEDLIVWMRTAALPNFRKLYRRVNHSAPGFEDGLPPGKYSVHIDYSFPVVAFGGRKSFIISTTTWLGGKNPFLGVAYLVVGSLCIVLGACFLIIHVKFARSPKSEEQTAKSNVSTIEPPMENIRM